MSHRESSQQDYEARKKQLIEQGWKPGLIGVVHELSDDGDAIVDFSVEGVIEQRAMERRKLIEAGCTLEGQAFEIYSKGEGPNREIRIIGMPIVNPGSYEPVRPREQIEKALARHGRKY